MTAGDNILSSWRANAPHWIATIDNAELESRVLVTNNAIVAAINSYPLHTILDIGCGEGWLTRTLRQQGKDAWGVDAIDALVENAIAKDGPFYKQASYKALATGQQVMPAPADAAVINFALIDKEDTEALLHAIPQYLVPGGLLFIQTLHPLSIAMSGEYCSGWKEGSWNGMKRNFEQPYQWYFRTLEDWWQLFANDYTLLALREPVHPETKKPLSVIFILQTK
ncbi:MAG TPA: class I SAM-dependent methyltransferase [Chitinophagaceae bacterium]|nr:class I SAM-dependent methyltransferase [Chitinophagaceae bacterium]